MECIGKKCAVKHAQYFTFQAKLSTPTKPNGIQTSRENEKMEILHISSKTLYQQSSMT